MTEELEHGQIIIDADRALPNWCVPVMEAVIHEALKHLREEAPEITEYITKHNPTADFCAYIARCSFWFGVGVGEQRLLNPEFIVETLGVDKVKKDKEW